MASYKTNWLMSNNPLLSWIYPTLLPQSINVELNTLPLDKTQPTPYVGAHLRSSNNVGKRKLCSCQALEFANYDIILDFIKECILEYLLTKCNFLYLFF